MGVVNEGVKPRYPYINFLSAYRAYSPAASVVSAGLIAHAVMKAMADNEVQAHEQPDGVIHRAAAYGEAKLSHTLQQLLYGKMRLEAINGFQHGKPLRGFPAVAVLKIRGQNPQGCVFCIVFHP